MIAGQNDIKILQGSNYSFVLLLREEDNSVVVLTGFDARMQIRERIASSKVLYSTDTGDASSDLTVIGAEGKIELKISAETTAAFNFRKAIYDLEVYDASGNVYRIVQGGVTLSPEVTR